MPASLSISLHYASNQTPDKRGEVEVDTFKVTLEICQWAGLKGGWNSGRFACKTGRFASKFSLSGLVLACRHWTSERETCLKKGQICLLEVPSWIPFTLGRVSSSTPEKNRARTCSKKQKQKPLSWMQLVPSVLVCWSWALLAPWLRRLCPELAFA